MKRSLSLLRLTGPEDSQTPFLPAYYLTDTKPSHQFSPKSGAYLGRFSEEVLKMFIGQRELLALVHNMLQKFTSKPTTVFLAHRPGKYYWHQAVSGAKSLRRVKMFLGRGSLKQFYLGGVGFLRLFIPLQIWQAHRGTRKKNEKTQRPKPVFPFPYGHIYHHCGADNPTHTHSLRKLPCLRRRRDF